MAALMRWRFAMVIAAVLAHLGGDAAPAPKNGALLPPTGSPPAVYAAFTLNLTQFVTWPESAFADPGAALVIGTFPRDPMNEHLDAAAATETFNGRPIRTLRIQSLDDVQKCHVIFVPKTYSRLAAVLERAAGKPILTIGDAERFLELGGHVRFVSEPPHTRLRVSVGNLKASGLIGRSQLLRFAAQ